MANLGLILSGGGARAAYEAGVIHYIRGALPSKIAKRNFEIQCGSSAGAINTAGMVSTADDPLRQGEYLKDLWLNLKPEEVYERDFTAAFKFFFSSLGGIIRNLTTFDIFKLVTRKGPHFNYLLNNAPLKKFLKKKVSWEKIEANIQKRFVSAVSITTTNARSGRTELFIRRRKEIEYDGEYRIHEVPIEVDHIMASAAIPLVFPTVKIDKVYYTDGGLRLYTPMSPAIQLGAERLLIIGLHHPATQNEKDDFDLKEMKTPPSVVQLAGRLMNLIFLDSVKYDLEQLKRINHLIERSEKIYGKDYLDRVNSLVKKGKKPNEPISYELKKIDVVEVLPSEFISKIFENWFNKAKKGTYKLSAIEKLLMRLLDFDTAGAVELLSYLTFSHEYIKDLVDLGYEDAKKNRDRLIDILS